jgi:pyrimidine-specific ribonucleoside hydrolase
VLCCLGKQPPVAAGADKPMFRDLEIAAEVHGESGLDGPNLPDPPWEELPMPAWELSRDIILQSRQPVTLIPTGPLTNIGILFTAYPEVKRNIARISLMGGSVMAGGNWSAAAEFNILVDPEAADIVFRSGVPITMSGLDVTHKALILPEELESIRALQGPVPRMVAELIDFYYKYHAAQGFPGAPMHDPCAVAAVAAPELFTMRDMRVDIETKGAHTTGMTLADIRSWSDAKPNVSVCLDIDRPAFARMLISACKNYH